MYELIELFEPSEIGPWLINVALLYVTSFFSIWFIALIFCRLKWFSEGRVIVMVYLGWLIPLCVYAICSTFFLLTAAKYYKDLGISLWFCLAYLIPVFLSGAFGIDLSNKIREIVKK